MSFPRSNSTTPTNLSSTNDVSSRDEKQESFIKVDLDKNFLEDFKKRMDALLMKALRDNDICKTSKKEFNNPNPENEKSINKMTNVLWIHLCGNLNVQEVLNAIYTCKKLAMIGNDNTLRRRFYREKEMLPFRNIAVNAINIQIPNIPNPLFAALPLPTFNYATMFNHHIPADLLARDSSQRVELQEINNTQPLHNNSEEGKGFIMVNKR